MGTLHLLVWRLVLENNSIRLFHIAPWFDLASFAGITVICFLFLGVLSRREKEQKEVTTKLGPSAQVGLRIQIYFVLGLVHSRPQSPCLLSRGWRWQGLLATPRTHSQNLATRVSVSLRNVTTMTTITRLDVDMSVSYANLLVSRNVLLVLFSADSLLLKLSLFIRNSLMLLLRAGKKCSRLLKPSAIRKTSENWTFYDCVHDL